MRNTLKGLKEEATEHGVLIKQEGEYLRLYVKGHIVAWLYKMAECWGAATASPTLGVKRGTKVECLDWALNHAIEEW